ncbi:hypothetical protein [Pseudomonas arsenicoxydans]|uniref:hypothetical protein n=1 Tax=Pseudomonas arsenicoxydans TaxID=702115 RepID=UPI0012FD4F3F|nr:hypothetical protein [Pseudomonas arsenicoxydans]
MSQIQLFMIYRMLIVLGGCLCIFLGYRLFYVVQERQGDFKVKYGEDLNIQIRDMAPGTYFAFCGTAILVASLVYKTDILTEPQPTMDTTNSTYPSGMRPNSKGRDRYDFGPYSWPGNPSIPNGEPTIHTIGIMPCKSTAGTGCGNPDGLQVK